MRIMLIMPGVGRKPGEAYVDSWKMEPLSLAVLAARTPDEVEVRFVDDRLEPVPYDEPTDAVALSVETYTARRAYQIAARFRQRDVPVILGGYHPTLVPEEAAEHADAIVCGEAEDLWPQVLADLQSRSLRPVYRAGRGTELAGVRPRREIFADKRYLPVGLVETGRGCKFHCEFCTVTQFFRHRYRPRPLDDVVADIGQCGRKTIFFVDDNIVADRARARELFAAIRPLGIRWMSQGSVLMSEDLVLLKQMRQSGCRGILVGFESLSPQTLTRMGKSWSTAVRDYEESIRRIHGSGIAIYATFVFGYESDGPDAVERSLDFAIRQKFFLAAFNHLVPFPGTPVYDRLLREGRLLRERWWLDPHYRFGDVAFDPHGIDAGELAEQCQRAREEFYRLRSVLFRATAVKSNCRDLVGAAAYFWLNLFSGREMRRRRGLPLGQGMDGETADGQVLHRVGTAVG